MTKAYRLGRARRVVNSLVKTLLRLGLAGGHTYLLSVSGRRSGRTYSTPVILVENGERWLVANAAALGVSLTSSCKDGRVFAPRQTASPIAASPRAWRSAGADSSNAETSRELAI